MARKCISQLCSMNLLVCAKASNFLYYAPQNINSPASLKKQTPLWVQLPVEISVTSNCTVLNSRFHSQLSLSNGHSGGRGSSHKNLERKTVWLYLNDDKNIKEFCVKTQFYWAGTCNYKKSAWSAKMMICSCYYFVLSLV